MATTTLALNDGHRPAEEIYTDIEAIQELGDIENWGDRRNEAELLLQEWLDLPDDTPDEEEMPAIDPRAEWLWEQLEPLHEFQSEWESDSELEADESSRQAPHVLDLVEWCDEAHQLLQKYWGDLCAYDVQTIESGMVGEIPVHRCEAGTAVNAAGALMTKFDLADNSLEGHVNQKTLPEYMIRYLYWGALAAHLEQGESPLQKEVLKESFQQFNARVEKWRQFPYIGVVKDDKPMTEPVAVLEWLQDWDRRGRPDLDAPLIRLNGQMTQADVGQMLQNGLERIKGNGLGGSDLTVSLLNLAFKTGQAFHSVRKAWDEFCGGVLDRELFTSVLDEILKGDEPMVGVEELAGPEFQRMVINDFQRQFDCDPMLVLLTVMAAMGTVLPLRTSVRGLSHTQHLRPGVLFVMILVVSGGMKSMLSEELVEKPIVAGRVGWEVKYYARKARAAQAALKKEDGLSHPSFTSAPEWIQKWANTIGTESPDELRHIVGDFTGEGIDRNAMTNDAFPGYRIGSLLTTDEGRQLMGGDRYKSGAKGSAGSKYTLDKLKRAWDGKGPSSVRGEKGRERNYERIRLGILAFIQPEIYDEIASDESDDACGFWPRFLAYEAAPVQLREGLTLQERREIAQNSTFRNYLDMLYGSIYSLHLIPLHLDQQVQFRFSEDAEDWWYPIQCQIGRESAHETQSGDGVMGRLLGKLPALVVDVSLLLHLLKLKGTNKLNTDLLGEASASEEDVVEFFESLQLQLTIPLETVEGAYKLCRQLMLRTVKQRNRAQGDGSGDRAQFLVKLQTTAMKYDPDQKGLPVGQLQRGWNGTYLKKHPETKDLIYQALGALSDRGMGELTMASSNNHGGFRYRWIQPITV